MQATASRNGKKIRNRKGRVAGLAKARRVRARKLREAKRAAAWKQTVRESKRVMKKIAKAAEAVPNTGTTQWATYMPPELDPEKAKPVGLSLPVTGAFRLLLGADISLARDIDGGLTLSFPSNLTVSLKA